MRRNGRVFWVVVCTLVLIAIPLTSVFAKVGGVLVVSGPGIDDEIKIVDFEGIAKVEEAGFFEVSRRVDVPSGLGEGFHLSFYVDPDDMKNSKIFEMVYHPMPDGQTGYVQMVDNDTASLVQERAWFQFPPAADKALRDLMTANGVDLNAALVTEKAAEAEAATQEAEEAAGKAKAKGKGKGQQSEALGKQLEHEQQKSTERQIRLQRMLDVAKEKGDEKAVARIESLMAKEQERYSRKLEKMVTKEQRVGGETGGEAAETPAAE